MRFLFFLALTGLPALAQGQVEAKLQDTALLSGQSTVLTIVARGLTSGGKVELPKVKGLRFIPDNSPTVALVKQIMNGRVRQETRTTWNVRVLALEPGTYKIEGASVVSGGRRLGAPRVALRVRDGGSTRALATLELALPRNRYYQGEPVDATLILRLVQPFADNELRRRRVLQLPADVPGLTLIPEEERPRTETIVDTEGRPVIFKRARKTEEIVKVARLRWIAEEPGSYELASIVYSTELAGRVERVVGFLEERLVPRDVRPTIARTQSKKITILPLPRPIPPNFGGLIGEYSQKVTVNPRTVSLGDTVRVVRVIEGTGNLALVPPFDLSVPSGFKKLGELDQREGEALSQILDLAPMSGAVTSVPPVPLVYFDTGKAEYVRLASAPIPIRVRGAEGQQLSAPQSDPLGHMALRPLKLAPGPRASTRPVRRALILTGLPLFLVLGLTVGRNLGPKLRRPARVRRKKGALRRLRSEIGGSGSSSEPALELRRCLEEFLAAHTGREAEEFSGAPGTAMAEEAGPELQTRLNSVGTTLDRCIYQGTTAEVPQGVPEEILSVCEAIVREDT